MADILFEQEGSDITRGSEFCFSAWGLPRWPPRAFIFLFCKNNFCFCNFEKSFQFYKCCNGKWLRSCDVMKVKRPFLFIDFLFPVRTCKTNCKYFNFYYNYYTLIFFEEIPTFGHFVDLEKLLWKCNDFMIILEIFFWEITLKILDLVFKNYLNLNNVIINQCKEA